MAGVQNLGASCPIPAMLDKERRENFLVGNEDSCKHKQNMCNSKAKSYEESFQRDPMRERNALPMVCY
jgi:hypothetical protein